MTDKEFFRKEVERLKSQLLRGACSSQIAMETRCKEEAYNEVLSILDSLQEEPVSDDLEKENKIEILADIIFNAAKYGYMPYDTQDEYCAMEIAKENIDKFIVPKKQEEPISEDLEEYINELSKQFPEVSFAKLSRIAVRVAKWQKEQMMAKAIDGYVIEDVEEGNGDFLLSADYLPKSMGLKDQQRVKVIVIKKN